MSNHQNLQLLLNYYRLITVCGRRGGRRCYFLCCLYLRLMLRLRYRERLAKAQFKAMFSGNRLFTEVMDAACHCTANTAALHNRRVYQWSKKIWAIVALKNSRIIHYH